MAGRSKAISDELLAECKEKLKEVGIRGEIGRRLQAIISAKTHGISKVAEIYNITRQCLMDWISAFKEEKEKGFKVKAGRGRKRKINTSQREELKKFVEDSGSTLSAKKLKLEIEERYGIVIGVSSAHRLLNELGFVHITGRPKHHKQDKGPKVHEEFKKK